MMIKIYSRINEHEGEAQIFNAFVKERFFYDDQTLSNFFQISTSIDKFSEIDEMIGANITQMTHRAHQEF